MDGHMVQTVLNMILVMNETQISYYFYLATQITLMSHFSDFWANLLFFMQQFQSHVRKPQTVACTCDKSRFTTLTTRWT